ncbi:MAG: ribbon-helix-helix domain-containing protein [Desulfurococcaceae archaeon]|jgi:metal-responsive CopG/Arc/MetJ family transcriptional regulator|nr:ribbon-helix-helix domain-containing protein [Desulfurococcaceae archaeon]MCC6057934.1 ribbon-helix-helix domain-containing protein [Desulfurococcaceae archaeon]
MTKNNYRVFELEIPLTKVISIKIDSETLKEADFIYRKRGFRSRSEFIREAIAIYIELLKKFDRDEVKRILESVIDSESPLKKR